MVGLLRGLRRVIAKALPDFIRCRLIRAWGRVNVLKSRVRLTIGVEPLSYLWGSDRGFPIYRYYVEQFLKQFAGDIRGHCLEFQNPGYAPRFGGEAVNKLDILHVDDSNPLATLVADLTKPNDIPSNQFDCIVCTHVLHIIVELEKAILELYRILRTRHYYRHLQK